MTGMIQYQFGDLGDGHANLMATSNDVAAEKDSWAKQVGLTMENWPDVAGVRFGELNQIWDTAAQRTTEFQTQLAAALQQSQQNGQNALQQSLSALESGG